MTTVLLELPADLRGELKEPFGSLFTDPAELLAAAGTPLITVGDMVTYHVLEAGQTPDVALVDERTKRTAVDDDVTAKIGGFDRRVTVENPPGTVTRGLLDALVTAIDAAETTLIDVDGEEDLAALPAVLAAPATASVVYGQPDEGMVLVTPDEPTKTRVRSLVERMDGDSQTVLSIADA